MATRRNVVINRDLPVMNIEAPRSVLMSGMYGKSFAYHTLSERLPVILTKVIDSLARKGGDAATIQEISKLKNEVVTNKKMEPFPETSADAVYWNKCLESMDKPYYFTTVWLYAECYVYRRLKDILDVRMKDLDPFQEQKQEAFQQNLEASSLAARKLNEFVNSDNTKEAIVTLLKLCLWANKCDLSLTNGADAQQVTDPVEMIPKLKANLLVDDTGKIADAIVDRASALQKRIDEKEGEEGEGAAEEEKPPEEPLKPEARNPCPSKLTLPVVVMLDIVCDNAGYELVTDLCLGHYLLSKGIVKRVRYHVKAIPWFVSDVTPKDFLWVVEQCATANYERELPRKEGEEDVPSEYVGDGSPLDKDPARFVTSKHLQTLGLACLEYLKEGQMIVEADSFWTSPTLYKDMKRLNDALYRKLQFAVTVVFKGDLNYRKLVGENNWPPTTSFEAALQGFIPAPIVAVRTIKADLVAGLPKGKWEELTRLDDKWMEKGEYGVIQFCAKKEEPRVLDTPCPAFGLTCKGTCK